MLRMVFFGGPIDGQTAAFPGGAYAFIDIVTPCDASDVTRHSYAYEFEMLGKRTIVAIRGRYLGARRRLGRESA